MDHSAHAAAPFPQGLQTVEQGYRITPSLTILGAGRTRVEFAILGPDGAPVTDFDVQHDKRLHFIAVQRDTSGFQHVHPVMDATGTWSVELDLTPGVWRFFADIVPTALGTGIVLGADVAVPGEYRPVDQLAPRAVADIDDYRVTLDGALAPGRAGELVATVTRDGAPVTDLEPYLAAYGHLVALRAGDLAFLHVHPEGDPSDPSTPAGPEIRFHAMAPSAGTYRLFLDFQHEGTVRTAEFTLVADGAAPHDGTDAHAGHTGGHAHH
ncbi:hypothetical protein ACXYTP_24370 [Tsukamurella ocularis]|uniref:hypothetical protein n=1 Tax=Tsukamurella ocularis TaxID=1970234 RepID=UPI0039F0ECDC